MERSFVISYVPRELVLETQLPKLAKKKLMYLSCYLTVRLKVQGRLNVQGGSKGGAGGAITPPIKMLGGGEDAPPSLKGSHTETAHWSQPSSYTS